MFESLATLAMRSEMMNVNNISSAQIAEIAGILGIALGVFIVFFVIMALALYVYQSWAWFSIAKKLKYKKAWLAWIPIANFFLLPILAKKDYRWGLIILIPFLLMPIMLIPLLGPIIYFCGLIFVIIMSIFWMWDIFEKRKYPGWLSLAPALMFIPIVNFFAIIAHLIIIGIIAWSK